MSDNNYENFCSICRRGENVTGKQLSLPGGLSVCSDCMQRTLSSMENLSSQGAFKGFPGMDFLSFKVADEKVNENVNQKNMQSEPESDPTVDIDDAKDDEPDEGDAGESEKKPHGLGSFPNIQFLNWSDLQSMMNPSARVKPKKKKKKHVEKIRELKDIPKPHVIKAKLDEYVIGQEKAKKAMAVAVYNHYKRLISMKKDKEQPDSAMADSPFWEMDDTENLIEKSNLLMLGPTGSGKTYLVRTLAKLLDVPLAITDATSLTEAGYIGDDIESVVSKLLAEADNDVERAERGIIFIDEIDKIAKKSSNKARDVSGESVQQGLLRLLEGAEVDVPIGSGSKNMMVPMTTVNTSNILFICGGAFPGLDEIIKKRLAKKTSMGYGAVLKDTFDKDVNILTRVTSEDLRDFGMIPEFIGRLPVVCTLESLTEEMLVRILKEPKNAIIKQYQRLFLMDEVKLSFTDGALGAVAGKALKKKTGARALRSILEDIMLDIMYEIPKDDSIGEVIITEEYIEGKGSPIIKNRG